jgi:hypothetical protein
MSDGTYTLKQKFTKTLKIDNNVFIVLKGSLHVMYHNPIGKLNFFRKTCDI